MKTTKVYAGLVAVLFSYKIKNIQVVKNGAKKLIIVFISENFCII